MTADVPTDALTQRKEKENEMKKEKNPSQSSKMEGDFALDHGFLPIYDATGEYPNEA